MGGTNIRGAEHYPSDFVMQKRKIPDDLIETERQVAPYVLADEDGRA